MEDETTQIGVRFDEELWQQFREDVRARKGAVNGHLRSELEAALREYINASEGGDTHDRLRNIEHRLDDLADAIVEADKKKKDESVSSRTEKRLSKILEQINEETGHSPKVHEEVVELAIRDNAGSSEPTIRRYKKLLQQDRELFEHPQNDRMYFTEPEAFVMSVNARRKGGKMRPKIYSEIVEQYGEDWWLDQQEETVDEQPKGFQ